MNITTKSVRGFTLVEIAIVLVIIGLLLGGVLKGQELINNAKVRAIADRQNSLKVAWFSFLDRYQALPGDYVQAHVYLTGGISGDGDGRLTVQESVHALQQMTASGYLRCPQCTSTITAVTPEAHNTLVNNYGGVMSIWSDDSYYAARTAAVPAKRLQVHTGPRIPSTIIGEVDRKIDDGVPNNGDTVYNSYDPVTTDGIAVGGEAQCIKADEKGATNGKLLVVSIQFWRPANSKPPVFQNCGAGVFI